MKKLFLLSITVLFFCACRKKTETPDYSALIVGKWVANSYQKDDANAVVNSRPYSLSKFYEHGWEFSTNKQIRYKNGNGWSLESEKDIYLLLENKTLTLNHDDGKANLSTSNFRIIELTKDKFTVHSDIWKSTFFLVKE